MNRTPPITRSSTRLARSFLRDRGSAAPGRRRAFLLPAAWFVLTAWLVRHLAVALHERHERHHPQADEDEASNNGGNNAAVNTHEVAQGPRAPRHTFTDSTPAPRSSAWGVSAVRNPAHAAGPWR